MSDERQTSTEGSGEPQRPPARPICPSCGSAHTQPFTHAGPAARVNMTCLDCGHLFKHRAHRG